MTTALSTGIRRAAARIAPDPAPDGELLSRFLAARDEAAFAVLVRRHAAMVFGTCRRVLGNAPDADDAFQAAFVVLVRKAHSLTDRACVGNFLYGVAFHTALKARAMATKRKAKEMMASRERERPESDELTRALDEELAHLPEKYREPVVLCELEGVSRKDAAGRLGVPEGTISSRLATAHRMLEKRLKARGFAVAGITAVLGGQAFAVSDKLADAAVRAAVNGPPAGVTHLAAEVTKMFLLNKLKVGTAVLAGVLLLLGTGVGLIQRGTAADDKPGLKAPVPKKDEKDQDRIQGLWQAESVEADGKPVAAVPENLQVRFKGNTITFLSDQREHTFELDAKAKPKALNLTPGDGAAKGKKLECAIYELDGDTLKICMDKEGDAGKRPTEFKTAAGDGLTLIVLKRVKEEKKDEDRIQGLWEAETVQVGGKQVPTAQVYKVLKMRFKGNVVTTITEDGEGSQAFALDPIASPKKLATHPEGKPKEKKVEFIYDLDGDTLKLCHNTLEGDAGALPTSFRAGPQDKDELIVFKRVTDAAEAIQGTWVVTELHQVGKKMTDEEKTFHAGGGYKITFTADTITHEIDKSSGKYRLDPTRDEKRIEFIENGAIIALALYDLNGDDLKLCVGRKPDKGMPPVAPTGFDVEKAPAGTFPTVYVMKRDKPKAKPADDRKRLVGKWVTKTVTFDPPFPVQPGERHTPAHHTLTFTDTDLTWLTFVPTMPKAGGVQTKPYKLDQAASPKELTSGDNECVYELDGDTLKVAMYFLTPGRPKGFNATDSPPKAGGHVILIELTRETPAPANPDRKGGGGDKKPDDATAILGEWAESSSAEFPPRVFAPTDRVFKGKNYWTFAAGGKVTNVSTAGGETRTGERQYELRSDASPKELVTTTGGLKLTWSYELSGDTLKVALCGDGKVRSPSIDPKDIPQGVSMSIVEFTRVKEDKPAADKEYSLKDGEVLKLLPAPFPAGREDIYTKLDAARGIKPTPPADTRLMAVTVDKGQPVAAHAFVNRQTPFGGPGEPLTRFLQYGLQMELSNVSDPKWLLASTLLDADIVFKKGATPSDLLTAFQRELKAKCGIDLVLEYRDGETEVVVIGGKHALNPVSANTVKDGDTAKASTIDLYADEKSRGYTVIASTQTLPAELARYVGRPVIDESDLKANAVIVKMALHGSYPVDVKKWAEDRDPAKVLKNLAEQTGLTFKLERRKVRALVVEQPKAGDQPVADKEYSLAPGEVLKLLPAPFPAGRAKVFGRIPAGKRSGSPIDTNLLAVSVDGASAEVSEFAARRWKDGDPVKPPQLLHYVKHLLGIDTATVSDPTWLLESTVLDADVVYRKGAKTEELLAALCRELKAKCGADVTFTFREMETEVVVLGGKHTLTRTHAFPGRPYNDAARVALTDKPLAGSGGRRSAHLPAELATVLGRPVVDESDLKTNDVAVWITTPSYDTRPQAADRDPQAVPKRFAEQTGLTAKLEKRKVRALVVGQANPDRKGGGKANEPAWKAEFRKAYGLRDGQLVRRVAPPYPDCREEYYKALFPNRAGNIPFDQWFTVFGWKDNWIDENLGQRTMPIKPDEGVTLGRLIDMTLKFPKTRVVADAAILARKVTGDWVVKAGADPEKVAAQLEAVLRTECELPVKFAFRDGEEEVFVLSGKYAAKPVDGSEVDVEVYANHLTERKTGGGGTGTLKEMLAAVERHVSKPVVLGKVEGGPAKVSWHYNVRSPMLKDPAQGIDTYRDDTDPAQVLGQLAAQTGLTVTTEKRKVRTLMVEVGKTSVGAPGA